MAKVVIPLSNIYKHVHHFKADIYSLSFFPICLEVLLQLSIEWFFCVNLVTKINGNPVSNISILVVVFL